MRYQYEFRTVDAGDRATNAAILYLYDESDDLLCMASFDDAEVPCQRPEESVGGHVIASYKLPYLQGFIDMLRSEKPLYFSWSPEARIARLTTAEEPVGEEELRRFFSFLYV
jgi:hypothetical protein